MAKKSLTPELSVVIPIVNPDRHLSNLRQLLSQPDINNVQFILIHDLRKNESSYTLLNLKNEFKNTNISLISGSFGSAGESRNAGLEVCKAEWIAFCDADDFLEISKVLMLLAKPVRADILVCQFIRRAPDGKVLNPRKTLRVDDVYVDPGFWRIIYKRASIGEIRFTDIKMGEDIVFLADILRKNPSLSFHTDTIYRYVVGNPLQSTAQQGNYSELMGAIKLIKVRNPKWVNCNTDLGLLARLTLSLLKSVDKRKKIKVLLELCVLFLKKPVLISNFTFSVVRREHIE